MLFIIELWLLLNPRHLKISRWVLSPRGLFCLVFQDERGPDKIEYTRDTIKYTMDINPQTKWFLARSGLQRGASAFLKNLSAGYFQVVFSFFFPGYFYPVFMEEKVSAGRKERDGEK